ncbi:RNA 3'-terminal phosphate cyclase/enolpyruvate transferase [Aspergillus pseudotamarii]|uniref:RNA 3'-terminal phosphate cyclase/enolpyruvate transferase n=1 Tax=Aspergillus pseudotamarii TaxID=132259 RepID=A0A5N6SBY4_ASPPS|nr:RNA 3'-terminal phosphate cyclase/enolpyruvate transferase [Aspergillus pseudotamarii]KAE8132115.1 RNA 3'-terminal phosphate cyclase/enolpyruvate transferase [Aspergillus pseudotamarii]
MDQSDGINPTTQAVHLDGRTLEGGGQLVRIAVTLSALTGRPVIIDHIRGNRSGKQGLKGSHLAAITYLARVSGSSVVGAELGSTSLSFYPRAVQMPRDRGHERGGAIESHINIALRTAGSVFLVFQALYPYMLHAGANSSVLERQITLSIVGGTNVSFSPSYDYVAQVLVPNFARVGLPHLSVQLIKRGWGTGPFSLGKVTLIADPLTLCEGGNGAGSSPQFPPIDLSQYQRGTISQVEITILAPDDPFPKSTGRGIRSKGRNQRPGGTQFRRHMSRAEGDNDDSPNATQTIRQFVENEILRSLHKGLRKLPSCVFTSEPLSSSAAVRHPHTESDGNDIPVNIRTTETTHHYSHVYILIVAHTSTGFRVGHDALFGVNGDPGARQARHKQRNGPEEAVTVVKDLVERCVEGFLEELYDPRLQQGSTSMNREEYPPCVDKYLRDQLVVFEALGRLRFQPNDDSRRGKEDERYWSLHMQTARWVCEEMLSKQAHDMKHLH